MFKLLVLVVTRRVYGVNVVENNDLTLVIPMCIWTNKCGSNSV